MSNSNTGVMEDQASGTPLIQELRRFGAWSVTEYGVRLGIDTFIIETKADRISVIRAEPEDCAAIIVAANAMALAAVVYGGQPLSAAEAAGNLSVTGNRALVARFATWFPLPQKTSALF